MQIPYGARLTATLITTRAICWNGFIAARSVVAGCGRGKPGAGRMVFMYEKSDVRVVNVLPSALEFRGIRVSVAASASFKQQKRGLVERHARPSNAVGLQQSLVTIGALAALWLVVALDPSYDHLWSALATVLMCLFLLRAFVLMHECGHGSLFASPWLNRIFGFLFGVVTGMPQYVWSQHHNHHHATNGNWDRYRGPLATLSVEEYRALSPKRQQAYVRERTLLMAPLGGFLYLLLNPRLSWLKGTLRLWAHLLRGKIAQPRVSLRMHAEQFRQACWATRAEYWHMTANNIALVAAWTGMCLLVGPLEFFLVYVISVSVSGGLGIVLFTVQHNFEHSHATGDEHWDYDTAALDGTSFLCLPRWLNWFTANIGYHHVHHLSARIPNYRLAQCHEENSALFAGVRRLGLRDVIGSLSYILWDQRSQRIISVAEYEAEYSDATPALPQAV